MISEEKAFDIDALLGKRLAFFGVDNEVFCVQPDGGERMAIRVLEDEADGYRSYLGAIQLASLEGHIFFGEPVAGLTLREKDESNFDGYELADESGHVWLRFGTDNYDDYYPCFVFSYSPPKESTPLHGTGSQPVDAQSKEGK